MVLRQKDEAKAVAATAKADHAAALAAAAARDKERKEEEKAAAEREKYNKLSPAAKMVHDAHKALEDEKRQAKMNKRQSSSTEPSSPQSPSRVRFCCLSILYHAVPRLRLIKKLKSGQILIIIIFWSLMYASIAFRAYTARFAAGAEQEGGQGCSKGESKSREGGSSRGERKAKTRKDGSRGEGEERQESCLVGNQRKARFGLKPAEERRQ